MERIVPRKSTRKKNCQPPPRTRVSEASIGRIIHCALLFGKLFLLNFFKL